MDLTCYLPAIAQHGLLTHRQAVSAGLEAREIARLVKDGSWVRLRVGAYVDGDSYRALEPFHDAPVMRMRAAALAARLPVVFSHDSAAILLELGCPDPRDGLMHIARRNHRATTTSGGIRTHGALFEARDVCEVAGLRVLRPARTAIDMVREHGLWPGMASCDAALRQGVERAELKEVAERMRRWPHKRRIDRAIELATMAPSHTWSRWAAAWCTTSASATLRLNSDSATVVAPSGVTSGSAGTSSSRTGSSSTS